MDSTTKTFIGFLVVWVLSMGLVTTSLLRSNMNFEANQKCLTEMGRGKHNGPCNQYEGTRRFW